MRKINSAPVIGFIDKILRKNKASINSRHLPSHLSQLFLIHFLHNNHFVVSKHNLKEIKVIKIKLHFVSFCLLISILFLLALLSLTYHVACRVCQQKTKSTIIQTHLNFIWINFFFLIKEKFFRFFISPSEISLFLMFFSCFAILTRLLIDLNKKFML